MIQASKSQMTQTWICKNEDQTASVARKIADLLSCPSIILIDGDLGAGKTVFCRALIRHLTGDDTLNVPSPTYTLVQTYDDEEIWHFDLYRMNHPDEIYDIGWEEALQAKLCLIEWPSHLGKLTPTKTSRIIITSLNDTTRQIEYTP